METEESKLRLDDFKHEVRSVINSRRTLPPSLVTEQRLEEEDDDIDNNRLESRNRKNHESNARRSFLTSKQEYEAMCQKVWARFSNKHQKSPSHINNNVQSCMKSTAENNRRRGSTGSRSIDKKDKLRVFQSVLGIFRLSQFLVKAVGILLISLVLLYSLITFHKPTQAFISRHTQDLIYPFMRALRMLSLPVVRRLPILTDLYEEPCLLSNPFYAIDDLDCWPCESVRHVIDLTGFSNFSSAYHHSGIPFIVKDAFKTELEIEDIRKIYSENKDLLGKAFVESNRLGLTTLDKLFSLKTRPVFKTDDFHVEWNINRVTTARLWRRYFPKPYFIPETTEVSVQHFMFIDQVSAQPYRLPLTEFANVFLTQTSGSRSIVLIPTESCHSRCKVVSAVLQPKDVLFYNWLFWRPMSLPADSSTLRTMAITYVGSFY